MGKSHRATGMLVLVTLAVAAPLVVLAATNDRSSGTSTPAVPQALVGSFTLWGPTPLADPCQPRAKAQDIRVGAPVRVRDGRGRVVAATTLSGGRPDTTHRGCVYRFAVSPLPVTSAYTVQVGRRLGASYSTADLARTRGNVALNLGLPS